MAKCATRGCSTQPRGRAKKCAAHRSVRKNPRCRRCAGLQDLYASIMSDLRKGEDPARIKANAATYYKYIIKQTR